MFARRHRPLRYSTFAPFSTASFMAVRVSPSFASTFAGPASFGALDTSSASGEARGQRGLRDSEDEPQAIGSIVLFGIPVVSMLRTKCPVLATR